MNDLEEIEAFVTKLVNERWENTKSALLLSALGLQVKRQFPSFDAKQLGGIRSLCEGIATINVIQHPYSSQKIGAIPADAAVPSDTRDIFMAADGVRSKPVYEDSFWDAFTRPIDSSRFVIINQDGSISISKNPDSSAKRSIEITEEDIVDAPTDATIPEKVSLTHDKIQHWISRNALEEDIGALTKGKIRRNSSFEDTPLSAMLRSLSHLSAEDLKRVSFPADIILKLSKRA